MIIGVLYVALKAQEDQAKSYVTKQMFRSEREKHKFQISFNLDRHVKRRTDLRKADFEHIYDPRLYNSIPEQLLPCLPKNSTFKILKGY